MVPDIHLASPQPFRGAGTRSFSLGHLATREKLPVFEKRLKTALSTLAGEHVYVVVFPGISPYAEIRIHTCRQTRMHLTNTGSKAMTFLPSAPRTGRCNVAAVTPESGIEGGQAEGEARKGVDAPWSPREGIRLQKSELPQRLLGATEAVKSGRGKPRALARFVREFGAKTGSF